MFYQKFMELCAKKGVSPTAAAVGAGLSNAAPSGWAKGAVPRKQNRVKLCKYFDVPANYLDGGEEKAAAPEGVGLSNKERELIRRLREHPERLDALLAILPE